MSTVSPGTKEPSTLLTPAARSDRLRSVIAARELWRLIPEVTEEPDQRIISRMTFRLIHLADILAVTPESGAPVQSKRTGSKQVAKTKTTTAKLGA